MDESSNNFKKDDESPTLTKLNIKINSRLEVKRSDKEVLKSKIPQSLTVNASLKSLNGFNEKDLASNSIQNIKDKKKYPSNIRYDKLMNFDEKMQ